MARLADKVGRKQRLVLCATRGDADGKAASGQHQVYGAASACEESESEVTKATTTQQRDDLKRCPFCGTNAIEQGWMAESDTATQWRIQCGNPFCEITCQTHVFAALKDAERVWQERHSAEELK